MTTQMKLTKRQREVADLLRNGWSLQVRVGRTKTGRHRAFLVRWVDQFRYETTEISFSVVDGLQKAHIIRPVSSMDNQRIWIYGLGNITVDEILPPVKDDARFEIRSLITKQEQEIVEAGVFNPSDIQDGRERIVASIVRRRGQPVFRNQLLVAYQGKCAITETDVEQTLEAAHIISYKGQATNHISNGLLLRADIHTLFDLRLIAVDTKTMTVIVADELVSTIYGHFKGKKLHLPIDNVNQPSKEALDIHRKESSL